MKRNAKNLRGFSRLSGAGEVYAASRWQKVTGAMIGGDQSGVRKRRTCVDQRLLIRSYPANAEKKYCNHGSGCWNGLMMKLIARVCGRCYSICVWGDLLDYNCTVVEQHCLRWECIRVLVLRWRVKKAVSEGFSDVRCLLGWSIYWSIIKKEGRKKKIYIHRLR